MGKDPDAYRTISEVDEALRIPPHVLRFWETKFPQVKPLKRGGGRRFYRRADVDLLRSIRRLLYEEGYTIRGVQRLFKKSAAGAPALDAEPSRFTPAASPRVLIEQFAAEIAACQAILSDALRAPPTGDGPGPDPTPPPPAAAEPAAPASAAPPP